MADLRFLRPGPIVDSLARRLRARGADYVIVLAHDGAFCDRDGATTCDGEIIGIAQSIHEPIDAIVSGHTHSLINATVAGIPVVQALFERNGHRCHRLRTGRASRIRCANVLPDSLAPDPAVARLVAQRGGARRRRSSIDRSRRSPDAHPRRHGPQQYPLGNLIADAMRAAGKGDVAVMNNGGIRTDLRAGTATYGSLFELQPFGNTLYRITVTGAALRAYLERLVARDAAAIPRLAVSLLTYDPHAALALVSRSARLADGTSDRSRRRSIRSMLNNFLAEGGEGLGLSTGAITTEHLSTIDLDALVGYLKTLPQPVRAPTEVRIRPRERTR